MSDFRRKNITSLSHEQPTPHAGGPLAAVLSHMGNQPVDIEGLGIARDAHVRDN
jgi:hypothetical protein